MGEVILETIDFELSKENGRTEIRPGASAQLDTMRRLLSRIRQELPQLTDNVREGAPLWAAPHIHHCTILPQLGFLVAVTFNPETGEGAYSGQGSADGDWELHFINGGLAYYKSPVMANLDEEYGELPSRIAGKFI